ncbi:MAG: DUF3307 domain-containing protein [Bacteroidota bacterium]
MEQISFAQGLVLIKLVLAHFFTDFIVQPKKWVDDKRIKKHKSVYLYWHCLIAGASSYLILMDWSNWYLPLIIMISHYGIDFWKLTRPNTILYFMADQVLHLLVIAAVWFACVSGWDHLHYWLSAGFNNYKLWLILLGIVFVVYPAQYIIYYATKKWSDSLIVLEGDTLKDAGKWIGIFERLLILFFVFSDRYEAIGFLIAAKSFIRFSGAEARTRSLTEYILIGTFISFTLAIGVGAVIVYFMK